MSTRKRIAVEEPEAFEVREPLYTKYRPKAFKQVIGQDLVVKSLKALLSNRSSMPHSFIFTGGSGTGKTTLARILASELKISPQNLVEIDAATNSGIDDMRAVTSTLRYKGFGEEPNKLIIVDEAHSLSKNAWQSLLKSIEEPPAHVFFVLCTTEVAKIPETIKTRCANFSLKQVKRDDIFDLLLDVCEKEGFGTVTDALLDLVAAKANGSPRMALSMLSMVHDCTDIEEAKVLLEEPLEHKELIEVARMLVSGKAEWSKVTSVLKNVSEPPESIRIIFVNYFAAVLANAKRESDIIRGLELVAEFSKPMNPSDKMAPILLAIGNIIYPA